MQSSAPEQRGQLRLHVIAEMTRALADVGDSYRAPDGVRYPLIDEGAEEDESDTVGAIRSNMPPTVQQVVRLEELPLGSLGSRRAIVRWSDGSQGAALSWYADEVQIADSDLLGKTIEEFRALHFRRDRDWLQS